MNLLEDNSHSSADCNPLKQRGQGEEVEYSWEGHCSRQVGSRMGVHPQIEQW